MLHGAYGNIIRRALSAKSAGPWQVSDLATLDTVVTKEFCQEHEPDCDSAAVLDWVKALSKEDREELIRECNRSLVGDDES